MIKIKCQFGWSDDKKDIFNVMCQNSPYLNPKWKNIEIIEDGICDYNVVFTTPTDYEIDKKKTIVFQTEPSPLRGDINSYWFNPPACDFFSTKLVNNFRSVFPSWYMRRDYNFLNKDFTYHKSKILSSIIGNKAQLSGQRKRYEFSMLYLDSLPYLDHYGRGKIGNMRNYRGNLNNKEDGLIPYKYHFNAENCIENTFVSEKLTDSILCECLTFYCGCSNVKNFIDDRCFIKLDLNNPDECMYVIRECIKNNEWEKRLEYIKKEKNRLLNEDNTLNIIHKIVNGLL